MINIKHLLKVASAWVSIVYAICYAGVAMFPSVRPMFFRYSLHAEVPFTSDFFSSGYFVSGLVIWNIVTLIGFWLFAFLYNKLK